VTLPSNVKISIVVDYFISWNVGHAYGLSNWRAN
jgi:hypothetical protein